MSAGVINIGFGNYVVKDKIVAIVSADSAPVRRAIQEARRVGQLVDATHGRRTRSVIFTDSRQIVVSGLNQETLVRRLDDGGAAADTGNGDAG